MGLETSVESPPSHMPVKAPGQQCPTLAPVSHLFLRVPGPSPHHSPSGL